MDVRLVMFKENGQRKEFAVEDGRMLLGRLEKCDLRIPIAEVSRRHAEIRVMGNAVFVKDLNTANGTYLNNQRIAENSDVVLNPGDHLVVGPVVFTIQINGDPSEVRPVKTKLQRRRSKSNLDDEIGGVIAGPGESATASGFVFEENDPISALESMTAGDGFLDDGGPGAPHSPGTDPSPK
jgi:pSer/pThr/pTyr-binding forkhead associated (FHA) protein